MVNDAMREIDLENGPVEVVGALDFDRTPSGISPRRLPDWTRAQIPDLFMHSMVGMGSGVRLAFTTNADVVELDVLVTGFRVVGGAEKRPVFQLVIATADGTAGGARSVLTEVADDYQRFVLDYADPLNVGFEAGEPATIRFAGLGHGTKAVELWLPHAASTELRSLRIAADATASRTAPSGRPRWLHYGSSISHCMEAETPTEVWPAVAALAAGVELFSLGLAGQCQLDQFVARTIRDQQADVISLKVGINIVNGDVMRERAFIPAVHGFLDTVREGHPDTPILIVSPIFCPSAEDTPGPTLIASDGGFDTVAGMEIIRAGCLTLRRIRELLADIVAGRVERGDVHLAYLDGLELFGADDAADLPDRLHPNNAGYARIGARFAQLAFARGGALAIT